MSLGLAKKYNYLCMQKEIYLYIMFFFFVKAKKNFLSSDINNN